MVVVDIVFFEIILVGKNIWGCNGKVVYRLKDKEIGICVYCGIIDGKFVLFGCFNLIKFYWECKFDFKYVKKGVCYIVVMIVIDDCGNEIMV